MVDNGYNGYYPGKFDHDLTVLLHLMMGNVREFIPFYGRTIQVSGMF